MRKLASVQRITKLSPIEGADKIEVADVLGWHVVVQKSDNFKVGDLVIYCEVDSLLPLHEKFEFLGKGSAPKTMFVDGREIQGYRIKTIVLRGQISQGICFPLTLLDLRRTDSETKESFAVEDETERMEALKGIFKEGYDLTKIMGIHKYDMPLPAEMAGAAIGSLPGDIPKTDETRIQFLPNLLERYADTPFYVTEKLDGASITIFMRDGGLHVGGRGYDLLPSDSIMWKTARELQLESRLENELVLQGEIFGPGINGNHLKQSKHAIRFFNVYSTKEGRYLSLDDFLHVLTALRVDSVPLIKTDFKLPKTVDEIVEYATRNSIINPNVKAEGIVVRPMNEQLDPDLGRLSFKVISPKYLLKHDE